MRKHSSFRFRVFAMLLVLFAAAFLLPASRTGDAKLYLLAAAVPGVMLFLLFLPAGLFSPDRPSLSSALALCGFGLLATVYISPDETLSQGLRCVAALFFLAAGTVLVRSFRPSVPAAALLSLCGLGMLCFTLWSPQTSFSLAEGAMVLLLLAVAAFLALRLRLPALLVALGGMLLFLLQKDLGNAAVWGLAAVLLFWSASDSLLWSGFSLGGAGTMFGFFIGFGPGPVENESPSVLVRIAAMPLIPPESVQNPVSDTMPPDSLFFLLGEQFGLIFLLCAVFLLVILLIRGASLAQHTRKSFHASLALGCILLMGLRALFFLGTAADLIPLSPGTFPFMTSSLPDLFAHFFLLGLLCGISARNESDLEEDARLAMLAR